MNIRDFDRLRARLAEAEAAAREMVARWMIERSYATGHGDTLADLLGELSWQTEEQRNRMLAAEAEKAAAVESAAVLARAFEERVAARVAAEREACARIANTYAYVRNVTVAVLKPCANRDELVAEARAASVIEDTIRARGGDNG